MKQTYLINMITNEVEAGPGTTEEMVQEANEAIKDGADYTDLVLATVTHTFAQPPAVAVKVDTDTMPSTIAEVEAKLAGGTSD